MDQWPLNTIRRRLAEAPHEWKEPSPPSPAAIVWGMFEYSRELLLTHSPSPPPDVLQVLDTAIAQLESIDAGIAPGAS